MHNIKAVLDTNIMVSVAFAKEGLAKELRDLIADEVFTLVTSRDIMKELYRVLHYHHIVKRFKPSKDDINEFIGMILGKATITQGLYEVKKIKDDPTDNIFLSCALEGKADYIVSRDPHLRDLKHYQGIQIIDTTTFIEKVKEISFSCRQPGPAETPGHGPLLAEKPLFQKSFK